MELTIPLFILSGREGSSALARLLPPVACRGDIPYSWHADAQVEGQLGVAQPKHSSRKLDERDVRVGLVLAADVIWRERREQRLGEGH